MNSFATGNYRQKYIIKLQLTTFKFSSTHGWKELKDIKSSCVTCYYFVSEITLLKELVLLRQCQ